MSADVQSRSRHLQAAAVGWIVGLGLGGLLGAWAGHTLLSPPADVLEAPGYTMVEARRSAVGESLRLNVSAEWSPRSVAVNQASGIVTGVVVADGAQVDPGQVLYTVDLRPVVAAAGEVPAFRDLSHGDSGADVAQLQELLDALGYGVGARDGTFGATTLRAVRAWQRDLGVEADGVVRRGDVVFVLGLPARVALDVGLVVGASLVGGEPAVQVLPSAPSFAIALPDNQARLVAEGAEVEILREAGEPWQAVVERLHRSEDDAANWVAILASGDDEQICRNECDSVPVGGETLLPSVIHVVPEVRGVTIPAAALVTTADGKVGVVLASGEFRLVTVAASAAGRAVVEGLTVGEQVRTPGALPGDDERQQEPQSGPSS